MSTSGQKPPAFGPLRFCQATGQASAERHDLIAKAAYYRAERRAFQAGHELEDWLTAELEVDQLRANAR
jgi:Protein of unknown function (DUF2934)